MRFFTLVSALTTIGFATAQESARFGAVSVSPCGFTGGDDITLTYNATTAIEGGPVPESVSLWVQGVSVTNGFQTPVTEFFRLAHNDNFDSLANPIFTAQVTVPELLKTFNAPNYQVSAFIIYPGSGLTFFGRTTDECPQVMTNNN